MYAIGDLIVYGSAGACRVSGIDQRDFDGSGQSRDYYVLRPFSRDGVIYAPVDTQVFMRPVISAGEAEALIDQIPSIHEEAFCTGNIRQLTAHYEEAFSSHSCLDLIRLTVSIYTKKRQAEASRRRIGLVDERFMKRAEGLLFGEFAAALNIPFDRVSAYIVQRLGPLPLFG